jgi:hypothetical protein
MNPKGELTLVRDSFDPTRTLIVLNGKAVASVPWQTCDEIAKSFTRAARAGEEQEKANSIVLAEAALIRSGAPFSLTSDSKIRDDAFTEAQWNSHMRKRMPMRGAPSKKRLGTPTIIKHRTIGGNGHV